MNVQQVGQGICSVHGTPILSQVGVAGSKVCFACQEDAKEKTGRTVVVTESSPDATGKVTVRDVKDQSQIISELPSLEFKKDEIVIRLTLDDFANGVIETLLKSAYDAIDNMPPFKTLKETKHAIHLQEQITELLRPKKVRKSRDQSTTETSSES